MGNIYRKRFVKMCKICGYQTSVDFFLRRHMISVHKITPKNIAKENKCQNCCKLFGTWKSLEAHRRRCSYKNSKNNIKSKHKLLRCSNIKKEMIPYQKEIVEVEIINDILEDSQNKQCTTFPNGRRLRLEKKLRNQKQKEIVHNRVFVCSKCNDFFENHSDCVTHTKGNNCVPTDKNPINTGKKIFGNELKHLQISIERMDTEKLSKPLCPLPSKRNKTIRLYPSRVVKTRNASHFIRKKYSLRNIKNKRLTHVKSRHNSLGKNKSSIKFSRLSVKNKPSSPSIKNKSSSPSIKNKSKFPSAENKPPTILKQKSLFPAVKNKISISVAKNNSSIPAVKNKSSIPIVKNKSSISVVKNKSSIPIVKNKSSIPIVKNKSSISVVKNKSSFPAVKNKSSSHVIKNKSSTSDLKDETLSPVVKNKSSSPSVENNSSPSPLPNTENFSKKNIVSPCDKIPQSSNVSIDRLRKFQCKYCEKNYLHASNLYSHIAYIHRNPSNISNSNIASPFDKSRRSSKGPDNNLKSFQCKYCDKSFFHSSNLSCHVTSIHTNPLSYKCNICGKGFGQKVVLDNHILQVHTTFRRFNCKYCDYATNSKYYCLSHEEKCEMRDEMPKLDMKKTDEKKYCCPICTFPSPTLNLLVTHIKNHSKRSDLNKGNAKVKVIDSPNIKIPKRSIVKRSRSSRTEMLNCEETELQNNNTKTVEAVTNFNDDIDKEQSGVSNNTVIPGPTVITEEIRIALARALSILDQGKNSEKDLEKFKCKLCLIYCLSGTALESHMKRHF